MTKKEKNLQVLKVKYTLEQFDEQFTNRIKAINEKIDYIRTLLKMEKINDDAERRARELEERIKEVTGKIARIDAKLNILRKERDEIKNIDLSKVVVTCPFCGAELNGEKAEEAIALHIAQINEKLEGIVVEEKTLDLKKEEYESEIERMKNEKESIKYVDVETMKTLLANLTKTNNTPFEETWQEKELNNK